MKFQKVEISFLIFGSILVVVFNVILVALKVLVVFEIFKETSNKSAVKFLSSRTVAALLIITGALTINPVSIFSGNIACFGLKQGYSAETELIFL